MCYGGGWGWGADALNESWPDAVTTQWTAGAVVEAAWGIKANHGGGYSCAPQPALMPPPLRLLSVRCGLRQTGCADGARA